MNTYDRMKKLCNHYRIYKPEHYRICKPEITGSPMVELNELGYYPTHNLIDELDKKIGVDTRGGLRHDAFCKGWATPVNYVGTRIRFHEEYIRQDVPPTFDTRGHEFASCSHWGLFKKKPDGKKGYPLLTDYEKALMHVRRLLDLREMTDAAIKVRQEARLFLESVLGERQ
jgi:hypothetical protein